jgi:hypothetical protein
MDEVVVSQESDTLTGNDPRVFISKLCEDLPEDVDIVRVDGNVVDIEGMWHSCPFTSGQTCVYIKPYVRTLHPRTNEIKKYPRAGAVGIRLQGYSLIPLK